MEFRTDWMKPLGVDRETREAEMYEGNGRKVNVMRYARVPRQNPQHNAIMEVDLDCSHRPSACGRGVHRRFRVDATRVKRIRLILSDEKFEGSRKHSDVNHFNLRQFGAPEALTICRTIYWCIETEE